MSPKPTFKRGQIWRNKRDGRQFKLIQKKGTKWRAVQLTEKNHHYSSSHTFLEFILRQRFELIA